MMHLSDLRGLGLIVKQAAKQTVSQQRHVTVAATSANSKAEQWKIVPLCTRVQDRELRLPTQLSSYLFAHDTHTGCGYDGRLASHTAAGSCM